MMEQFKVIVQEDRPEGGQWHTGPNPCWITVTHIPTMISATAYGGSQVKTRKAAMDCVEMMVDCAGVGQCRFPERMS